MASKIIKDKAAKFSRGHKLHGWELAWLVASSCEAGQPGRPKNGSEEPKSERVSFREFATLSGVSRVQVSRYYKAWELAAADGQVPHAEKLDPLSKVKPEEIDGLEVIDSMAHSWSYYYQAAKYGKPSEDPDFEAVEEEPQPVPTPTANKQPVPVPTKPIDVEVKPTPVPSAPKPPAANPGGLSLGVILRALTKATEAFNLLVCDGNFEELELSQLEDILTQAREIQQACEVVLNKVPATA